MDRDRTNERTRNDHDIKEKKIYIIFTFSWQIVLFCFDLFGSITTLLYIFQINSKFEHNIQNIRIEIERSIGFSAHHPHTSYPVIGYLVLCILSCRPPAAMLWWGMFGARVVVLFTMCVNFVSTVSRYFFE